MHISLYGVTKTYRSKNMPPVEALKGIFFELPSAGLVFILGKSGCGKSTLLNILGGLDDFDDGDVTADGVSLKTFSEKQYDEYRNKKVGFVFQENNLFDEYTVEYNVGMALELQGERDYKERVKSALKSVELEGYEKTKPNRLSGGQKQRVAIARALVKQPELLLCDEPTGALDSETGETIFGLLKQISQTTLVVVVSHDRESAEKFGDRIIELKSGQIISDRQVAAPKHDNEQIAPTLCADESQKHGKARRGGLPAKSAFKMGAGMLVASPVRLIFAFILCLITFVLFGAADTVSAYDINIAHYNTMQSCGAQNFYYSGSDWVSLSKWDVNALQQAAGQDVRLDMIYSDFGGEFNELDEDLAYRYEDYGLYANRGYAEIDEQFIKDYGFKLVEGRLPQADDEAVITLITYRNLQEFGVFDEEINDYSDIIFAEGINEEYISIGEGEEMHRFKVTGILDTNFNASVYGDGFLSTVSLGDEMKAALNSLLENGMHSILYLRKGYHDANYPPVTSLQTDGECCLTAEDFVVNGMSVNLADEQFVGSIEESSWFYRAENYDIAKSSGVIIKVISPEFLSYDYMMLQVRRFAEENWDEVADCFTADRGEDTYIEYANYILNSTIFGENEYQPGYDYDYFAGQVAKHFLAALQDGTLSLVWEDMGYNSPVPIAGVVIGGTSFGTAAEFYFSQDIFDGVCRAVHDTTGEFNACVGVVSPYTGSTEQKMHLISLTGELSDDDGEPLYALYGDASYIIGQIDNTARTLRDIFLYVCLGLVVMSVLLVMYYTSGVVREKKREIGIMRALGAKNSDIIKIFAVDNGIFAAAAIIVAAALAAVVAIILNSVLVGEFVAAVIITFGIRQVALIAAIAIFATVLGIAVPVVRLMRAKPVDIIAGRK